MIRAVNRCTLEINRTGSPYFERAICFVKPEFVQSDRLDLHRAAKQLIAELDSSVEDQVCSSELEDDSSPQNDAAGKSQLKMLMKFLPMALSAIAGAGVTLLIMLLV